MNALDVSLFDYSFMASLSLFTITSSSDDVEHLLNKDHADSPCLHACSVFTFPHNLLMEYPDYVSAATEIVLSEDPPNAKVTLREISRDTVRAICDLKVSQEQEKFVAANSVSIAEAYFSDEAWFRAIYADEIPVGFVMLYEAPEKGWYGIWRLMIDQRYQRVGHGRKAMELIVQHAKSESNVKELLTSCHEGKGSPKGFYEKMGFKDTGRRTKNGELIMELKLQ